MSDDPNSAANESKRRDELAQSIAKLSDEKRVAYEKQITQAVDQFGNVSTQYKLDAAKTFGKDLSPQDQRDQLDQAQRREAQRNAASQARDTTAPDTSKQKQPTDQKAPDVGSASPSTAQDRPRNYADLIRSHEGVAGRSSEQGSTPKPPAQDSAKDAPAAPQHPSPNRPRSYADLIASHERVAGRGTGQPLSPQDQARGLANTVRLQEEQKHASVQQAMKSGQTPHSGQVTGMSAEARQAHELKQRDAFRSAGGEMTKAQAHPGPTRPTGRGR